MSAKAVGSTAGTGENTMDVRAADLLKGHGFVPGDPAWSEARRFALFDALSGRAFRLVDAAERLPAARAAPLLAEVDVLTGAVGLIVRGKPFPAEFLRRLIRTDGVPPGTAGFPPK
jgi:hypothetical protein